jgi:hypothetical protein
MPANDPIRLAFLEIFERDQTLIVRPPISHAVFGLVMFLACELVGWGLIYVNFTQPGSDWQPNWEATGPMRPWSEHSVGDRLATIAFLIFFCGAFIAAGFFPLSMGLRHVRPWVFRRDDSRGRVSRARRNWDLAPTGAIRLRPTRFLGARGIVIEVDACAPHAQGVPSPLRIHRVLENKGLGVADIREQMRPLAQRLGSFIGCPVVEQDLEAKANPA